MATFLTFLQLQLSRILNKPTPHAKGPKKPSLGQIEGRKTYGK